MRVHKPLGTQLCGIKLVKLVFSDFFGQWSSTNTVLNLFARSALDQGKNFLGLLALGCARLLT